MLFRSRSGARGRVDNAEALSAQTRVVSRLRLELQLADESYSAAGKAADAMTVPTARAATAVTGLGGSLASTGAAARATADDFGDLYERLFPESITRRQIADLAMIETYKDRFEDVFQARLRALGADGDATVSSGLLNEGPLDTSKVTGSIEEIRKSMEKNGAGIGRQTVSIAESFAQMSRQITGSLQGLANSIRSGDFLGILGGVLDIFTTLGSAGVFGKGLQGNLNRVPGNANGTRNFGGGLSVVGERGPELVNLPRRSQVIPNHKLNGMGGGGIAQIVPSPYFDVVVDGRVMRAAPMVANAGAMQAQSMGARSARRTVRR